MKVSLISFTTEPIDTMYVAARTCYSSESPLKIQKGYLANFVPEVSEEERNKRWKLVGSVLKSGHTSIAEHVNFTFAIEGISRACSHQLVRHRHCTFSQQSQRYVEIKESAEEILQRIVSFKEHAGQDDRAMALMEKAKLMNIAVKYFVDVDDNNLMLYCNYLVNYLSAIQEGMKAEDARMFLPNATKTNIVVTTNLRNLIHILGLRCCTRAQWEIRAVYRELSKQLKHAFPFIEKYLDANCVQLGYCPEGHKSCGRFPSLKELQK